VIRDGTAHDIAVGELVAGNLVELRAGDQLVADGVMRPSTRLQADESLLTVESDPVDKVPGDRLLSGSFVIAGSGGYQATGVGAGAYARKLATEARHFTVVRSDLMDGINRIEASPSSARDTAASCVTTSAQLPIRSVRPSHDGVRARPRGRGRPHPAPGPAGTGRNLPYYPPDATVTGIEISPAMLAVARQRAADLGRDVNFREGDAEHLTFDDASFDTAVCALSLCTIHDPAAAIGEMKRFLVPGGRLLLLDHIGSAWPPLYAAQWLLEQLTIPAAGEYFTRRPLFLVQAAGFQIVETERLKAGTVERVHAVKPV
jgi:hypothetical protein